ncbi:unnamed protein product, partial [Scytosiphon promiscuus]
GRGCRFVPPSQIAWTPVVLNMRDPHPLAIIPLQKDLLLSLETSSNSSHGSTPSSPGAAPASGASDGPLPIRALVPHRGSPVVGDDPERGQSPVRSEDDTALMRSLISVMPHERADSQFSVTSPVRRSDDSDTALRHESWFRTRRPKSSAFGGNRGTTEDGDGGSGTGGGRGGGRGAGSRGAGFRGGGGGGGGLDFLGTTDSVRELFHLPFTNEAVTVGLHRVGQTLVLDGNLDEVLAPAAAAAAAAAAATASPPSSPPPTPSPEAPSASAPAVGRGSGSGGSSNSTVVGGGDEEGRWIMVGRGGKPQQRTGSQGHDGGQEWARGAGEDDEDGDLGLRNTAHAPPRPALATRDKGRRGWEVDTRGSSGSGESTSGVETERRGRLVSSVASPALSSSPGGPPPAMARGGGEWSATSQAASWPALGASATAAAAAAAAAAGSSGDDAALVAPSDPS